MVKLCTFSAIVLAGRRLACFAFCFPVHGASPIKESPLKEKIILPREQILSFSKRFFLTKNANPFLTKLSLLPIYPIPKRLLTIARPSTDVMVASSLAKATVFLRTVAWGRRIFCNQNYRSLKIDIFSLEGSLPPPSLTFSSHKQHQFKIR